jgi:SM-20-related protein
MTSSLRLNPELNLAALRETYDLTGRLHVPQVLEAASARRLHNALETSREWVMVFNRGNTHFDLTPENAARMPKEAMIQLQQDILAEARDGFQLVYDVVNVSKKTDTVLTTDPVLLELHAFLNGRSFLDFMARITGETRGAWCDVTGTRYRPGHFCEAHDDSADDGERLVAFVLNLTPRWRVDWGGLLLFIDGQGNVATGLTPAFNALNLFRTPQLHAVSAVTPFAGANRISVTGWMRPA